MRGDRVTGSKAHPDKMALEARDTMFTREMAVPVEVYGSLTTAYLLNLFALTKESPERSCRGDTPIYVHYGGANNALEDDPVLSKEV